MSIEGPIRTVQDGLIFHLDAGNDKSYPGSGTTVYDLTGRGNTSTFAGAGTTYTSSNAGAFSLNGSSTATINIGTCNRYFPMPSFTLETWVRSSGLGSGMTLGGIIGLSYGTVVYIEANGTVSFANYSTDAGYPGVYDLSHNVSTVNFFDDIWHHIACTRSPSTYEVYIDSVRRGSGGVSVPTWSGTNIWSSMDGTLGNNPNDAFYRLKGFLSLPKIYNRALSANEVLQNYNAAKSRFGL